MTDKNNDDTDFNLNKFESIAQDNDSETTDEPIVSTAAGTSYADDEFPPPWASDEPDSNHTDGDRIEPGIPEAAAAPAQTDLFGKDEIAEINHFEESPSVFGSDRPDSGDSMDADWTAATGANADPDVEPPIAAGAEAFSTSPPEEQRSENKPITLFAMLAILIVAVAIWFNLGSKDDATHTGQLQTETMPATDTRMQSMENRITSLERHFEQQNDAIMQQIDRLERDLNRISRGVNQQARQQHSAQAARKAPANVHPVKRRKPVTVPVAKHQTGGWVVSLISVDTMAAAKKAQADLRAKGISTEISPGNVNGKTWYRVRVPGFANKEEALAQQTYLANKFHINNTWVHKP